MKKLLVIGALLLSAPALAKDCQVKGLLGVTLPNWASCEQFRFNFELAKFMVLKEKWRTEEELEKAWGSAQVTVLDKPGFPCGNFSWAQGCTYGKQITMSREGDTFFHELLHLLEPLPFIPVADYHGDWKTEQAAVPLEHPGWEERGWNKVEKRFRARCIDLSANPQRAVKAAEAPAPKRTKAEAEALAWALGKGVPMPPEDPCAPDLSREERVRRLAQYGTIRQMNEGSYVAGKHVLQFYLSPRDALYRCQ